MASPFFSDTLKSLVGFLVGVFSNDGMLIKGVLVDVKEDYLILQNKEEQHIYHHLSQIKSVSKNAKKLQTTPINSNYLQADQLHEILEQCKYKWITVNCFNDQLVTGLLSKVFDDHLVLLNEEEQIIMQTAYISNIFPGVYEPDNTEQANEAKEETENKQEKTSSEEAPADNWNEIQPAGRKYKDAHHTAEKANTLNQETSHLSAPTSVQIAEEEKQEKAPPLTIEEKEKQLEGQYYSLMKQAEKKYLVLRSKRIEREKINK